MATDYTVTASIWEHSGPASWHFLTLPPDLADEIRALHSGDQRAFGSLPVRVTLGASSWDTSMFADTKAASYLLPLKGEVRRREGVGDGDVVTLTLAVRT